jgi:hypothetical protein
MAKALKHLLEIKRNEGDLPIEDVTKRLDEWWASQNA